MLFIALTTIRQVMIAQVMISQVIGIDMPGKLAPSTAMVRIESAIQHLHLHLHCVSQSV